MRLAFYREVSCSCHMVVLGQQTVKKGYVELAREPALFNISLTDIQGSPRWPEDKMCAACNFCLREAAGFPLVNPNNLQGAVLLSKPRTMRQR